MSLQHNNALIPKCYGRKLLCRLTIVDLLVSLIKIILLYFVGGSKNNVNNAIYLRIFLRREYIANAVYSGFDPEAPPLF